MENSGLPLKYWFSAIYRLTSSSYNFSMAEIQEMISDAEQVHVHEMSEKLNVSLGRLKKDRTFDQLLLACIENYDHPPATYFADQENKSNPY